MLELKTKNRSAPKGRKTVKVGKGLEKRVENKNGTRGRRRAQKSASSRKATEEVKANFTQNCLNPELQTAATLTLKYHAELPGFIDGTVLAGEVKKQLDAVNENDLSALERILAAQITTLDQLFHGFVRKAFPEYPQTLEAEKAYMAMAMRAQSQTRAAIETLAEIKNPQPLFQQHNVAYNQQINNGQDAAQPRLEGSGPTARAEEGKHFLQNELLMDGRKEHAPVDSGRTQTASKVYREVETVGKIDRAAHPRRESRRPHERHDTRVR
jgi:hypothetical protein